MTLAEKPVESSKRKKECSLSQIMAVVENTTGVSLKQLRASGKSGSLMTGRRIFSHTARDYGYQGKEIAQFLHKDPAAVTGYCKRKDELIDEIAGVHRELAKSKSQ
jgi:chromosomal replication initiation ATPase DnaA